jgi:PAS domain S-box-containing protein
MDVQAQADKSKHRRYYPIILGLLLAITVFLAVYVNVILGIEVVYTHLFYIPIILAGIWYHRKAIYVALSLGVLHIVLSYASDGMLRYESFLRALVFVATAYLVGTIAARKDLLYDGLKASEDSLRRMRDTLEQQVRERTQELSEINESLKNEITERNKAENSLMLARFSIDRAADFIAWINPDGSFHYVNDALCKATGYSRDELLVMKSWEIEPESPKDKLPGQWKALKESGYYHTESTLRARDDHLIPVTIMNNYIEFRGAFTTAALGYGNTPRNAGRGPGFAQVDLGISKLTKINERFGIQFIGQMFNLLNHPNFANPSGYLDDLNFGKSTSTIGTHVGTGTSRQTQLALKFIF